MRPYSHVLSVGVRCWFSFKSNLNRSGMMFSDLGNNLVQTKEIYRVLRLGLSLVCIFWDRQTCHILVIEYIVNFEGNMSILDEVKQ